MLPTLSEENETGTFPFAVLLSKECSTKIIKVTVNFILSLDSTKFVSLSMTYVELCSIADFLYQEAFLTTYRTFLSPLELIQKLCYRHQRFHCSAEVSKQRAAKESFSLLVRVVSDLT